MLACATSPAERRSKPHPNQVLKCPRCESLDTKFCYYNNYSTTQPRYFCKNCKRYWTEGGALRNVPVGGGLRKNKRSKQRTSSMPLSSSSPGQHARASPFAFEGLHLHASHAEDLASSFSGSPTGGTEIAAFRYLNGQSADPNGYESCIYKAGDQPSSQNQFDYNDVRHFPQFYTGYRYNNAMRDVNQNDFEGYSHPGPGRSDQSLPSCARGSGAIIDPDHGSYKGLRITSLPLSSGGLHGHRLHEQGEHRRGVNESDGMTMGYFYEHKRPCSEEVMLNEEDGDANQLQPSSNELMLLQDNATREATEGGGSREGVSNAMNVGYPYDWQQISEGLFGGTADYYYMQAGGSGVGGGSGGGSEAAAAVGSSANWAEFNVGAV